MPPMYKYSSIFLCNLFLVSNRLFVQPKAKHLSFRKIPLKQFRLLGRVSLVLSIILALMVVPTTITMASAYRALSNDYALWDSLTDAVSISYNDVDGLYTEEWQPKVESFFAEMADKDNLCLSIAIDREILLDKGEMGKYDHIWLSQTEHSSYSVSPYALLWNNDIYYLVGFHDHRQQVVKFRVDRIDGLKVTQKAAVQKPKDFDVSAYFTQEFSMLTGKTCHITLLCETPLMNSIIDRFGEDAPTQIVDENHFTVEATVDLSSNFYGWVFSSGGKMKITAPQEAVDGFQRMLEINSNPPVKTSHLKGGQA